MGPHAPGGRPPQPPVCFESLGKAPLSCSSPRGPHLSSCLQGWVGHLLGEAVPLDTGGGQSCARCPSAGPAPEMASMLSLQEENQLLQQELSRVEDLLAQSRAERDELAIKYSAVSERVGAAGLGAPDGEGGPWSQAACVQVATRPPRVALNMSLHSARLLPEVGTVTTWSCEEWMGRGDEAPGAWVFHPQLSLACLEVGEAENRTLESPPPLLESLGIALCPHVPGPWGPPSRLGWAQTCPALPDEAPPRKEGVAGPASKSRQGLCPGACAVGPGQEVGVLGAGCS